MHRSNRQGAEQAEPLVADDTDREVRHQRRMRAALAEGVAAESASQPSDAVDVAAPAGPPSPGYPDGVLAAAAMLLLFLLGWRVVVSLRGDSYGNSG